MSEKYEQLQGEYDYFFSLGEACPTAMTLKQMGLRSFSGPFDWVVGMSFSERLNLLQSNDPFILDSDEWEYKGNRFEPEPRDIYVNKRLNMLSPHDFLYNTPLDVSLPIVKKRYERRLQRVRDILHQDKKVLFVYMSASKSENFDLEKLVHDCSYFNQSVQAQVHVLYIQNTPNELKITSLNPFFDFVKCPYSKAEGQIDIDLLKKLFSGYHCTTELANKKWLARQKLKKKIKSWFINKRIKGDDFYYRILGFKYRPKHDKIK